MTNSDDRLTGMHIDDSTVDDMEMDGEAVVLNLQTQSYFGLNSTATDAWGLIKDHPGIGVAELTCALAGRYDRAPDSIAADIGAFVDELRRQNLVTDGPVEAAAPRPDPAETPYLVPRLDPYGELDALILSGE